jgi:hypothetical protein
MTAVWRWKFESSRRFTIIQTVQYLIHLTVPIESCFGLKSSKSCIWDLLHHIDVGSFYFAMFDEFHQHTKVHRVYILYRKWHF